MNEKKAKSRVLFYTFGCKVNQYETEVLRANLSDFNGGDTIIINSCGVTEKSELKMVKLVRKLISRNPDYKIVITGCASDLIGPEFNEDFGNKVIIVSNKDKNRIPSILSSGDTNERLKEKLGVYPGRTRGVIKIQDGCKSFCSYCIVPYIRKEMKSKPLEDIIDEAREMANNGHKEIVISGINLGQYGKDLTDGHNLLSVLKELIKIDNLFRIRLSSINSNDLNDELLELITNKDNNLCKHLHIPLQSGADNVLKRMNRRYSSYEYEEIVNIIRERIPDFSFTTDVIVGFPGETENDFLCTVKLFRKIKFAKGHIFPFSSRKGTKASGFQKVNSDEVNRRMNYLLKVEEETASKYASELVGSRGSVIVEKETDDESGLAEGRLDCYLQVEFGGKRAEKNQIIDVKIKGNIGRKLIGEAL